MLIFTAKYGYIKELGTQLGSLSYIVEDFAKIICKNDLKEGVFSNAYSKIEKWFKDAPNILTQHKSQMKIAAELAL